MVQNINKFLARPALYEEMAAPFWDDAHISKQMLNAHLDPEFEGASRKLEFIERSAAWIKQAVPPSTHPALLDIGCGPGIYAERFAKAGFQAEGLDFSKRSIDYARDSAREQGLNISYHCQNYLHMELNRAFDFITMIYCDYGALSMENRKVLMEKAYRHLRPGGKFLLDAFSMEKYRAFVEKQTWESCPNGGFWREKSYVALHGLYKYTENVTLEQIAVLSDAQSAVYYLWTRYFTKETLMEEAVRAGFKVCGVFGDVAGTPYAPESLTVAVLLEK